MKNKIIKFIKAEIDWCEEDIKNAKTKPVQDNKKMFIKGLKQAISIIKKVNVSKDE